MEESLPILDHRIRHLTESVAQHRELATYFTELADQEQGELSSYLERRNAFLGTVANVHILPIGEAL